MSNIFNMNIFNCNAKSNVNLKNSTSEIIAKDIKLQCANNKILYTKIVTGGNDPKITKKMRYASYVRSYGTTNAYNNGSKVFTNIGNI